MADIVHSIQISEKPEVIYPLLATAPGLGQWWASDFSERDGLVELGFFNRTTVYGLRSRLREPLHAEWMCESGGEWGGTRISFRLEPVQAGTLVRFAHSGWRACTEYFTSCNTTWGALLFRLKAAAEGRAPGPLFTREGWVA